MPGKAMPCQQLRFLAESTLGKLSKWLRLAGFDTLYDPHRPDAFRIADCSKAQQRIVLTRTRQVYDLLPPSRALFIRHNAPLAQVRQVMQHFAVLRRDLQPLTRCAICNAPVEPCPKEKLIGQIADYIWQRHDRFHCCPQCKRIFWPGSHTERLLEAMQHWFI